MTVPHEIIKYYIRGLANLRPDDDPAINSTEEYSGITVSGLIAKTVKSLMISDNELWGKAFITNEIKEAKNKCLLPYSPIKFQGNWKEGKQLFPIREYLHLCDKYRMKIHPFAAIYILENSRNSDRIAMTLNLSADHLRDSLSNLFPIYDFRNKREFRGNRILETWLCYHKLIVTTVGLKSLIGDLWQVVDNKTRLQLVEILSEEEEFLLPDLVFDEAPYSSKKINSILAALKLKQLIITGEVDLDLLKLNILNTGEGEKTVYLDLCVQFNCNQEDLINRFILLLAPGKVLSQKDLANIFSETDSTYSKQFTLKILRSALKNNDSGTAMSIFEKLQLSPNLENLLIQISSEGRTIVSAELFFKLSTLLLAQNGNRGLKCFKVLSDLFPGFWPDSISTVLMKRLKENDRNPVEKKLAGELFRKLAANGNPMLEKNFGETLNNDYFHPFSGYFNELTDAWIFRKRLRVSFDQTTKKSTV